MRILLILLVTFLIGCAPSAWTLLGHDTMYIKYNKNFTIEQFDSICKEDTLPNNFEEWKTVPFVDAEDGSHIKRYLYIKRLNPEQIYIATDKDSIIQINKRIAK